MRKKYYGKHTTTESKNIFIWINYYLDFVVFGFDLLLVKRIILIKTLLELIAVRRHVRFGVISPPSGGICQRVRSLIRLRIRVDISGAYKTPHSARCIVTSGFFVGTTLSIHCTSDKLNMTILQVIVICVKVFFVHSYFVISLDEYADHIYVLNVTDRSLVTKVVCNVC